MNQFSNDNFYKDECYAIQGAVFEVYRNLGCGFLEAVYQESLELELKNRGIPFVAQVPMEVKYKGHVLSQHYKPDFICYGCIILGLKAVSNLLPEHRLQVSNYLNASELPLGLLVNFGHYPLAEIKRIRRTVTPS